MKIPKNISASKMKAAKEGDCFILQGHSASKTAVPFRAGWNFTTHMGFMVFKPSMPVVKITVITLTTRKK